MLKKLFILLLFFVGLFLMIYGFRLIATVKGVIIMLISVAFLLLSLFLYNLGK